MLTPIDINGLTVVALAVLLTAVVWNDIKTHRIENVSVMAIILLGLFSQLLGSGVTGILNWLGGMVVGFGFLLPFYIGGGMAAGDVKLLAAVGSVLGPMPTVFAAGVTLIAGLLLALLKIAKHNLTSKRTSAQNPSSTLSSITADTLLPIAKQRLPYAAAIAVGTVGGLLYAGRLQDFFGVLV